MVAFLLAALVLLLIAYAWLLPPLWKQSRSTALAVVFILPLALGLLYTLVGNRDALDPAKRDAAPTMDQAVDALATRMRAEPDSLDGWVLLGQSRKQQQRYSEAHEAFKQARRLAPRDPDLMVELAEVIALEDSTHRVQAEALTLLQQALQVDPRNQRALWFVGIAQYQQQRYAEAAATWQPLLQLAPPQTLPALRKQIDQARALAGLAPLPPAVAAGPALLSVRIDISAALKARLAPTDVLFVLARRPGGPPMPLAVKRVPAQDFPITITLADADGPMPTMRLSQQKTVEVLARVSKSGDALPQSGDFEAHAQSADVGGKNSVDLVIDQIVP